MNIFLSRDEYTRLMIQLAAAAKSGRISPQCVNVIEECQFVLKNAALMPSGKSDLPNAEPPERSRC